MSPQTEGQTAAKSMCLVSVSELKDSPKVTKENINSMHGRGEYRQMSLGLVCSFSFVCFV